MKFLLRIFWFFSLVGFLVALFYTYGHVKQTVAIQFAESFFYLSRNEVFFFFLFLFVLLNGLIIVGTLVIKQIPSALIWVPQQRFWTSSFDHRKSLNEILSNWMWALACTANYFFTYWLMAICDQYHFEDGRIDAVTWFHWPGVAMALSLILPLFRLFIPNPNLLNRTNERE